MLTAPQLCAGVSALCLVAAIAWLVTAEFPVVDPGKPTTKADPVLILEAAVPAIGDFTQFNVNDVNPFVPFNLREVETKTIKQPPPKTGVKPPPKAQTVEVPKIVLPKLGGSLANGPKATGVLLSHDSEQAFLTFPGDNKATTMKPGDSVRGWTLVEVIGTNVARMKDDATGAIHDLVVAETPNAVKAKKTEEKKEDKKPGKKDDKTSEGKTSEDKGATGKKTDKPKSPEQNSDQPADNQKPNGHKHGEHKPGGVKPEDAPAPPPAPPMPAAPPEKML